MICRCDTVLRATLLALTLVGASGCDEAGDTKPSIASVRADLASGHPLAAEAGLRSLRDSGADPARLAALAGEAALARRDFGEAHAALDRGEFVAEDGALGWRMRGRLAVAEGRLADAGRDFDRALQAGAPSAALWIDIARLRYAGGEHLQAMEALERARGIAPEAPDVLWFGLQVTRDRQGPAAAAPEAERLYRSAPEDPAIVAEYAATLGDAMRAREALQLLRDGAGQHPRALFLQSVIAARGGAFATARSLLQRCDEDLRAAPAGQMLAAVIDLEQGNPGSAAQTLAGLSRAQPDNIRVRELWAASLARLGEPQQLVRQFAGQAAGPTGSPYLQTLVGRAYERLGDRAAAAPFLDRATRRAGGLARIPSAGGSALAGRDAVRAERQPIAGIQAARAFLLAHPGSADGLSLLGDAMLSADRSADARSAYATAASVRQPWHLAKRRLAAAAGPAEAADLLRAFIHGNPMSGEAAALLADARAAEGRWPEAAVLLDHALANGMRRVPWVNAARSQAAARLGRGDEALTYALQARSLQPMSPEANMALMALLPVHDGAARAEYAQKLRALPRP